ncbi:hypothetical protein N431DRAFT_438117 [Stipitochalara longipes BDJ]|nr:hypothetical protein N431DRAFT_438117 [Stipitochalara longipes BDJ]
MLQYALSTSLALFSRLGRSAFFPCFAYILNMVLRRIQEAPHLVSYHFQDGEIQYQVFRNLAAELSVVVLPSTARRG